MNLTLEDLIILEQALNTHFAECYLVMGEGAIKSEHLYKLVHLKKVVQDEIDRRLSQ